MRRLRIEWDEDSVDYIARHGVEPEEVEKLLMRRHLWHRGRAGRYEALIPNANGFDGGCPDMPKQKIPRFTSLREEREFWQTHDAFDVAPEQDWQVVEAGAVQVESVYVSRVDRRGAILRVPRHALSRLGAKPGSRIEARVEAGKLVIEPRAKH